MQTKQRISKCTDMQVFHFFSRQNSDTFDISHAFFPLTVAKLSTLKNSTVYLAHPVHWPGLVTSAWVGYYLQ